MPVKRSWLAIAFLNLVVIAFLGLLLRWQFVAPVAGINFKNFLHAHSHVALLGWLYTALFVTLLHVYLPEHLRKKRVYAWQFWLAQAAVLGMLVSFPIQGYALFSITFSTAHILISYWFAYQFLKDARQPELVRQQHKFSFLFIKAALFFMVLSSLGPWAMGPIMATGNSFSNLYYNAIYFYLHFQYNGWFTFAVLGLLFWLLERYHLLFNHKQAQLFFRLMFWVCIPAYLLSVLWTQPHPLVYWVAGAAALLQVVALVVLVKLLLPIREQLSENFNNRSGILFTLAATAFTLKTLMQAASALPYVADLAFKIRHFIIGYLHLVLIGFVSLFLFALFLQLGWLCIRNRRSSVGISAFIIAFLLSEALLFLQGLLYWLGIGSLPHYDLLLFLVSIFLPLGLLVFLLAQLSPLAGTNGKRNTFLIRSANTVD